MSHSVNILFEIRHAETSHGETLGVVGNLVELGAWDSYTSARQLHTGVACYPLWSTLAPISLAVKSTVTLESPCSSEQSVPSSGGQASAEAEDEEGNSDESSPFLRIEYKYIKDRRQIPDCGPSIQWEDSIANRFVTIPAEPGSMWIVSDARFNDSREPPRLARTSLIDMINRSGSLDMCCSPDVDRRDHSPEWTASRQATSSRAPFRTLIAATTRLDLELGQDEDEEDRSTGRTSSSLSHHTTSTVAQCLVAPWR
mmetsp:Transcript_149900/g.481618  ORF Transcript_149900/g.481618 Transcript_149900/m.481618 type:complete len:256 (-) Transcript_149900:139-906(-)